LIAVVTGAAGLVGSEAATYFGDLGFEIVGIDNDMRRVFFGEEASTRWNRQDLETKLGKRYTHVDADIRDLTAMQAVFQRYGKAIDLIIHTAAQPSHDWAARDPLTDFGVNATGTLNLLELTRQHCPDAVFIFLSTNKVYGDTPNALPLHETESRWEIDPAHPFHDGIDESMSIDNSTHSLFGVSKASADLLVQEYGRYFGLKTGAFRGGCLTGPRHSGAVLHGFLAYLMKCAVTGRPYTVYGYEAKQVRDNLHSSDLVTMFHEFYKAPRVGQVYNAGGSRFSHCSMREAIGMCEEIAGRPLTWTYSDTNRIGDHIWYVSNTSKFRSHFPDWKQEYDIRSLLQDIYEYNVERWADSPGVPVSS
jgi:CDP-paratose 2-epimerase